MVKHDTLLICSGSRESRQTLRHVFSDTFHLLEAGDVSQLSLLLNQNLTCIAAVILDISTGNGPETQWLEDRESRTLLGNLPVILLVKADTPAAVNQAFGLGAADVIPLGYDSYAMLHRVENIVDLHLHKQHLEAMVEEQKQILRHTSDTMVDALSSIIEYRSVETGQHVLRIRYFTRVLLEEVAKCCPEYGLTQQIIDIICSASALHDIGKIAIPDSILMKPGALTAEERKAMQTHTLTGCRIIETLEHMADKEYLRYAHNICHYHHERWDGSGYPEGIQGEAIPICAQVVGLADVYDALTSRRVYKDAYSFSKAVNMIFRGECGVFSPKLLECFKHVAHRFEELASEYADGKAAPREPLKTELPLPEFQGFSDAIERIRGKYFALVHYINGLLIELDMDRRLFHLIYNPYPELSFFQEADSLEQIEEMLTVRFVHPEDREAMDRFLEQEIGSFLDKGQRRASFRIRARGTVPEGDLFELTLMRINPLDNSRRTLAVLARKLPARETGDREQISVPLEGTYLCRNDQNFTLLQMGRAHEHLAGYSLREIQEQFDGKLLELAHPEDRDMIRREFTRQLRAGTEVRLEFRIVQKDGSVRWVYNQSTLVTDPQGQEAISSFLVDIQNLHREDNLLQEKLQRYEMILAQTENVLFEWDMTTDAISFSNTWEKIFGYQVPDKNCRWSQQWTACLYPDDMPLLMDCLGRL